ncbi:arabinosyltransferase [Gordonia sp. TBRC 11910]|uniref:Arabinosyltransferase n=1 Tax=Gordonia asplenii TaxID=2725283 RepID=A0A848KXB4_9ACTN|nr:arabinosyltransferase domain-containing protein [Gordonia asplenii]NMO02969.1 arabinosyltransferase [Gordonia asplenii]
MHPPCTGAITSTGVPVTSPAATRLVAVIAGIVGVILCGLTPLLPVKATDASFSWPSTQRLGAADSSVTAPLIAQTAKSMQISIPCRVLADLPAGPTTVLATMPTRAGASAFMLSVKAEGTSVTVTTRNAVLATAARSAIAAGGCTDLKVWSTATGIGAQFAGLGPATVLASDKRPQIDGIFSDLTTPQAKAASAAGLHARIDIDNRYASSPTILKLLVMILGVLAVVVSLVALYLLDRIGGYHRNVGRTRAMLRHSLIPRPTDIAVTAILVLWALIGAGSPDDGYILNMGRVAVDAGYLPDYYRFFGIAETPFDWYYSFLSHWSAVSPSILWMHIPSLLAGLASWFVLTRILLPRLGPAVRRSGWAQWAAAMTFVAFWLPFCSGLRSEGIIVAGSLLTWWAVEQAIATRRLLPAALAALAAGFTFALAPHGVIGMAILLVAARPMLRILLRRRREVGLLPLLAPLAAAGMLVVIVVFRDQTLATVAEAIKIRYQVGPKIPWYQEYLRYYFISVTTPDGGLPRRVPVLLLFTAVFVTVAVILRRTRIRGVDNGPTWRLIGAVGVTLILLAFTPTKWTIQFGIFAGLAAAAAATATLAIAQTAASSTRNLTVLISGLFFALAAAMAGKNAWPYGYNLGIAWFDRAPVIAGIPISGLFLVLAVVTAGLAAWQHLRQDYVSNRGLAHGGVVDDAAAQQDSAEAKADRRRLALASSPLAVIAAVMVLAEVLVFAKAAVTRYPTVTVFSENVNTLRGKPCALADQVLAEPDANAGMLEPAGGQSASQALAGADNGSIGFSPNGIPDDLHPDPGSARPGQMNVAGSVAKPFVVSGAPSAGTTGGRGPTTVNGSHMALPFGLDPKTTPVLGSYAYNGPAQLTTDWYRLPDRSASPLLVISAAGSISTVDAEGARVFGQPVLLQFGRPGPAGTFEPMGPGVLPIDPGPVIPNMPWRNLRIPMTAVPPAATVARILVVDNNLGPKQFVVVTPPRAPELVTLQKLVGSQAPALIDFTVAAHFPCQRPMAITHGVAQIPRWRILGDYVTTNSQSKTWQAASDGGLLGVSESTTSASTVPTYLSGDWHQDWGALERLTPLAPDAVPAKIQTAQRNQWGWSRTGSIRVEPDSQ